MVQDFSYRLMYQGIKLEEYLKYLGQSMKEFRAQFVSQATPRVLQQLVIEKIVKDENITATDKEVDEKIAEQAKSVDKNRRRNTKRRLTPDRLIILRTI